MKKHIKTLSKWSKWVGIIGLLLGALFALGGFPLFYVGAIPGLLMVIVSLRLIRASRSAKRLNYNLRLMQTDPDLYDETLIHLASFFKLQGLLLLLLTLSLVLFSYLFIAQPHTMLVLIQKQYLNTLPFL